MNFIIGFIFGIVVVSVGFAGITKILDNSVNTIQETVKEIAK
jgi:capsular polysaccharide biosynthesis protein